MSNIDFSATSDLENLIAQAKFERIFFLCGKKSYFLSGAHQAFKKILKKKITKFYFKSSLFPEIVELKKIIISLKKFSPDLIIAVGGGTVIDYAKIANSIDLERNLEKKNYK
jgi:alcohol dehydrogenase class IV